MIRRTPGRSLLAARPCAFRFAFFFASLFAFLVGAGAGAGAASAGTLRIYEATVGAGRTRVIVGGVVNALVDVDYAPVSAEGGKLYGVSELEIEATGNLVLTPTGFACQAVPCLFSPSPFVTGKRIRVTAGNDLVGSTATTTNLLTIGLTGSSGYVVVTRGEYVDGTGPGATVGAVRSPDVTVLVSVPEPGLLPGLAAAGLGLLALATRARASARSGSAPASRAPRGR